MKTTEPMLLTKVAEAVIIRSGDWNKRTWKLGVTTKAFTEPDGAI